jgi:transposase-like protein
MARNSTKHVSYKDLRKACADLKAVYTAGDEGAARDALEPFGKTWNGRHPMVCRSRGERRAGLREYFKCSPQMRPAIYTANAIGSLNCQLRKLTKSRPTFSTDGAVFKTLYLAMRNASEAWTTPIGNWGLALSQFAIGFGKEPLPF